MPGEVAKKRVRTDGRHSHPQETTRPRGEQG